LRADRREPAREVVALHAEGIHARLEIFFAEWVRGVHDFETG
jgi:hypothetical protein